MNSKLPNLPKESKYQILFHKKSPLQDFILITLLLLSQKWYALVFADIELYFICRQTHT